MTGDDNDGDVADPSVRSAVGYKMAWGRCYSEAPTMKPTIDCWGNDSRLYLWLSRILILDWIVTDIILFFFLEVPVNVVVVVLPVVHRERKKEKKKPQAYLGRLVRMLYIVPSLR